MKNYILFLSLFMFVFASCDDGRLYQDRLIVPEEGRVVKLHVNMSGVDTWPDGYTVVLAGFNDDKEYSLIAKSIPNNGDVDMVMAGIGEDVTSIELCVTNRIRERVYSFYTQDFSTVDADTTRACSMPFSRVFLLVSRVWVVMEPVRPRPPIWI